MKERVWAEYARGNYDKAMQEIELLEQIAPNHPTAAMIRQRIRDRMLQGKPLGVPIRSEFERPVPAMVSEEPEPTFVSEPAPELPSSIESAAQPQPSSGLPSKSEGINPMIVMMLAASIVILLLIFGLFLYLRRSRQHLHDAMSTAASSLATQTVRPAALKTTPPAGTSTKQTPATAKPARPPTQKPAHAPKTDKPSAPQPAAIADAPTDIFPGALEPPPQPEPAPQPEPPRQKEAVYDLPTTVLMDESEEPIWEHDKHSPPAPGTTPAAPQPPAAPAIPPQTTPYQMPPAVAAQVGNVFGGFPESDSQTPEVQQTQGETFTPYGTTGQSVGEVISGQPKAPAGDTPSAVGDVFAPGSPFAPSPAAPSPAISQLPPSSPLPPLPPIGGPSAPPPSAGPASVFPPLPAANASSPSGAAPMAGAQGLVLPDIFSMGGAPLPPSSPVQDSAGASPAAPPPAHSPFVPSPPRASAAFPPVPAPAAPEPASPLPPAAPFPPMPMPIGAPPPVAPVGAPSASQSGDLSLDGLLFSPRQGETESATVGAHEPIAPAQAFPPISPGPAKGQEDMTATSFGREFDQLMFAAGGGTQAGAADATGAALDQTLGIGTPHPSAGATEGPASTENVLNMLVGGEGPSPAAPQAMGFPGSPRGAAPFTPAPGMAATHKMTGPPMPSAPTTPFSGSDTIPLISPALDDTVKLPPTIRPLSQSGGGSDEALYQSQRQKGLAAFAAGDLKHAIHFLSVAASLRPDDQEVIQKLQEARRQRRASAGG
jgi:hypothetical protein